MCSSPPKPVWVGSRATTSERSRRQRDARVPRVPEQAQRSLHGTRDGRKPRLDQAEDQAGSVHVQLRAAGRPQGSARSRPAGAEGRGSRSRGAGAVSKNAANRGAANRRGGRAAVRPLTDYIFGIGDAACPPPTCLHACERVLAATCEFAKICLLLVGE